MTKRTDQEILRDWASRVKRIAEHPCQDERRRLWLGHNRLAPTRPLVLCLPENAWHELVPESAVECRDPLFRTYEWHLRHLVYRWEHMADDFVTEPVLRVPLVWRSTGFGLNPRRLGPSDTATPSGHAFAYNDNILNLIAIFGEFRNAFYHRAEFAYKTISPLVDPDDLDQLQWPELTVDQAATDANVRRIRETVGDLLDVRPVGITWLNCSLIGELNALRGMEPVMTDFYDRPRWVHRAMEFLTAAVERQLDQAERNGWLGPNHGAEHVGSSLGFTDELPAPGFDGRVRLRDQWGHATVQSAPYLSPAMQEEFVFQYQRRLLARYGLTIYGCCEPLNAHNLASIQTMPRLRKLIVSPWSDLDAAINALAGRCILAWKPNPVQIAPSFDLERSRRELAAILEKLEGCPAEIILKDIHTVDGDPTRIDRYLRMAGELIGVSPEPMKS